MADLHFTDSGDVALSPSGDLALTESPWRDDLQQAYIRVMTDAGDYLLYDELGASLSRLYGMPQSRETGRFGEQLISAALDREGRFIGKPFDVNAVPIGPQAIRFDVSIVSGSRGQVQFSVEQELGFEGEES